MKRILFLIVVCIIFAGCSQMAWDEASKTNTLAGYHEFIEKYPDSEFTATAKSRAEDIYWQQTQDVNDIQSYNQYIKEYSNGKYLKDAAIKIEELNWASTEEANSISIYKTYLKEYPNGKYMKDAVRKIEELNWASTRKTNTASAYEAYISQYPSGIYSEEANILIEKFFWERMNVMNTVEAYDQYIKIYPTGKYINQAKINVEESTWALVEKTKNNISLYRQYLDKFPNGKYAPQASDCNAWAIAEAGETEKHYKDYLAKFPKGKFSYRAEMLLKQTFIKEEVLQNINRNLDEIITNKFNRLLLKALQQYYYSDSLDPLTFNKSFQPDERTIPISKIKLYQPTGGSIAFTNKGGSGELFYGDYSIDYSFEESNDSLKENWKWEEGSSSFSFFRSKLIDINDPSFTGKVIFSCDVLVISVPSKSKSSDILSSGGEIKIDLEIKNVSTGSIFSYKDNLYRKTENSWALYIEPVFSDK